MYLCLKNYVFGSATASDFVLCLKNFLESGTEGDITIEVIFVFLFCFSDHIYENIKKLYGYIWGKIKKWLIPLLHDYWSAPPQYYRVQAMRSPSLLMSFLIPEYKARDVPVTWAIQTARNVHSRGENTNRVKIVPEEGTYALYVVPDRMRFWFFCFGISQFILYFFYYKQVLFSIISFLGVYILIPFLVFRILREPVLGNLVRIPKTTDHAFHFASMVLPRPKDRLTIRLPSIFRRWAKNKYSTPSEIYWWQFKVRRKNANEKFMELDWKMFIVYLSGVLNLPGSFEGVKTFSARWHGDRSAHRVLTKFATIDLFSSRTDQRGTGWGLVRWIVFYWTPVWSSFLMALVFIIFYVQKECSKAVDKTFCMNHNEGWGIGYGNLILPGIVWMALSMLFEYFELRKLSSDLYITEKEKKCQPYLFSRPDIWTTELYGMITRDWTTAVSAKFYGAFAVVYLVIAQVVKI